MFHRLQVESLDQAEDHLLLATITEDGEVLEPDVARWLFSLGVKSVHLYTDGELNLRLQELLVAQKNTVQQGIATRNINFLEAESEKLDGWADDMKVTLEREIKDIDRQIKESRRAASLAPRLEEKLAGQKQIKTLESLRNSRRRALFDAQDEIDRKRADLIEEIEGKLQQEINEEPLFTIRWRLV